MKPFFSRSLVSFLAILGVFILVPAAHAAEVLAPFSQEIDLAQLRRLQTEVRKVANDCLPATVAILNGAGSGSGVVIDERGLILTAAHVVERSKRVKLVFPDGKEADGKVLGAYYTRDIAMVQIEGPGRWPHVNLGSSDALKSGEWVVALGHAKGYDPNRPPPARFARVLQPSKRSFLLTDCTLIGGDSGGPLFNLQGELVGIHSSIGNNLSINNHAPIDAFQENWDDLVAGKKWGQLGRHPLTDPDSPVLGISMQATRSGIAVAEVFANSPASRAGLMVGDRLLAINANGIRDVDDLLRELSKCDPEQRVSLKVRRGRRELTLPVTLMRRADVFPNQPD